MPEDNKKEEEPLFIDETYLKVVGLVSSKINMLINTQLLNSAVIQLIRQATDNIWN